MKTDSSNKRTGNHMKIVVIGGSGLIGKKVVSNLRKQGHEVVAASPSSGVNTLTGEGLAEALAGAQVVVDVANSPSFEEKASLEFFERSGRNLFAAEAVAGVRHYVALSVVGTERLLAMGIRSEARPGKTDQGFRDSLFDRSSDAVLRIPRRDRSIRDRRSNGSTPLCCFPAHCCGRCRCCAD